MASKVYIDSLSALAFWRWFRVHEPDLDVRPSRARTFAGCARTIDEIDEVLRELDRAVQDRDVRTRADDASSGALHRTNADGDLGGRDMGGDAKPCATPLSEVLGKTLHLAFPRGDQRCQSRRVRSRVIGPRFSPATFYRVTDDIFVLSPEAAYARASLSLSLPKLVLLGMEFCGTYSLDASSGAYRYGLKGLTSNRRLLAYVSSLRFSRNSRLSTSVRALTWVLDGSASVMETAVAALLTMPPRFGGYGLEAPLLNPWIGPDGLVSKTYVKGARRPDAAWIAERFCLEYNGREWHCGIDDYARDSDRREWFESLGYTVVPISSNKLYDPLRFHDLALTVAKSTGKRLRLPEGFEAKRDALRKELLPTRRDPRYESLVRSG